MPAIHTCNSHEDVPWLTRSVKPTDRCSNRADCIQQAHTTTPGVARERRAERAQPKSAWARGGHWQADGQRLPGDDQRIERFGGASRCSHETDCGRCGADGSSGGVPKGKQPVLPHSSPGPLDWEILLQPVPPMSARQTEETVAQRRRKDRLTQLRAGKPVVSSTVV